jgi:hypothetical protein
MRYSLRMPKPDDANAAADIADDAERYDNANAVYAANAVDIVDDVKRAKRVNAVKRVKRDAVYPSCYIFSFPISSSGRRMNQNNYTIF